MYFFSILLFFSVFCCSFHPELPDLVVSGGEDDAAYIWNATSGEVQHKVNGYYHYFDFYFVTYSREK